MVFVEKGDASQASAAVIQSSEKIYEGILELIKFFLDKQKQKDEQKEGAREGTPPEPEYDADSLSAQAFQATTEKFGSEYLSEGGEIVRAAQVGDYLVVTDPTKDAIDCPTYHVYKDGVEVFAFEEDPQSVVDRQAQAGQRDVGQDLVSQESIAKQYTYHETKGALSAEQKMQFLKDFEELPKCNPLDNPDYGRGMESVERRLESLGERAPLGSCAALVGEQLLRDSGQSQLSGKFYTVSRQKDGAIAISHNGAKEPFCTVSASGKLSTNANFTPTDRVRFQQMHDRLSYAREQQHTQLQQWQPADRNIAASNGAVAPGSLQFWQRTTTMQTAGHMSTVSVSVSRRQPSTPKVSAPRDVGGR